MLPSLADIDDLQTRLRADVDDTLGAQWMLDYASALVRAECHETWVDEDGELDEVPDAARLVTVEIVYRALTNPAGATTESEQAGPFQHAVSYGPSAADRMYLTKADRTLLGPLGRGRAFSIDTTPETSPLHDLQGALVNGPAGWAPGEGS